MLSASGCFLLERRSRDAGEVPPADASSADSAPARDAGAVRCALDDRSSWAIERFDAGGNYERAVAAVSGVPWVAVREHDGDLVMLELGVGSSGILVKSRVPLEGAPFYPLAFDTDGTRFVVLATSGQSWNGDVALFTRNAAGAVQRVDFPAVGPESSFTVRAAVGWVGRHVALASVRASDDEGWLELRDERLDVIDRVTRPHTFSAQAIRTGPAQLDVYLGTRSPYAVTDTSIAPREWTGGEHEVVGGLDDYLVEYGSDFRIRRGERLWSGPWPHTQISPPAILRTYGALAAFSLQKELSGTVGYTEGDQLAWLDVEPASGASGIGVALLPVLEERRLGFFYVGLEIPHPEQPLRYYGLACDPP